MSEENFQFGSIVFPLAEQVKGTSLLSICDPALANIINYLSFEINLKLGKVLTSVTKAGNPPIAFNIKRVLSVDPMTHAQNFDQIGFPLFAMWRDRSLMSGRTLNWKQEVNTMQWCYTLPAMTLEQSEKFAHVLHAVVAIVNTMLHEGHDPAYQDDIRVIGANEIASARLLEATYGFHKIGDQTSTVFNSVHGKIEVTEQTMEYTVGLPVSTGTAVTITQQSTDIEVPIEMIDADTAVG